MILITAMTRIKFRSASHYISNPNETAQYIHKWWSWWLKDCNADDGNDDFIFLLVCILYFDSQTVSCFYFVTFLAVEAFLPTYIVHWSSTTLRRAFGIKNIILWGVDILFFWELSFARYISVVLSQGLPMTTNDIQHGFSTGGKFCVSCCLLRIIFIHLPQFTVLKGRRWYTVCVVALYIHHHCHLMS